MVLQQAKQLLVQVFNRKPWAPKTHFVAAVLVTRSRWKGGNGWLQPPAQGLDAAGAQDHTLAASGHGTRATMANAGSSGAGVWPDAWGRAGCGGDPHSPSHLGPTGSANLTSPCSLSLQAHWGPELSVPLSSPPSWVRLCLWPWSSSRWESSWPPELNKRFFCNTTRLLPSAAPALHLPGAP